MNFPKSSAMNRFVARFLPMSMAERLHQALSLRGRDPASLIASLQASKGLVYNILNGATKPEKIRADTALAICRELGVQPDWLVFGKGPMTAAVASSQTVGIDPEILAAAMKLLTSADAIAGITVSEDAAPYRIALAYEFIQAEGGAVPDSNVLDFTTRLAKKLREGATNGDFGRKDSGAGSQAGGSHARKRAG